MQTFIREDFKEREHTLNETDRKTLRGYIKFSNHWLKKFHDRCKVLNKIVTEAYKTLPNGDKFKTNFRAAVKAVSPALTWDDNGDMHINREVFISQIDSNEVTDPDAYDDEAEDLAPESAQAVGGAGEEPDGDLEEATHTDEVLPHEVEDITLFKAMDNIQAGQQTDRNDGVIVEEEVSSPSS